MFRSAFAPPFASGMLVLELKIVGRPSPNTASTVPAPDEALHVIADVGTPRLWRACTTRSRHSARHRCYDFCALSLLPRNDQRSRLILHQLIRPILQVFEVVSAHGRTTILSAGQTDGTWNTSKFSARSACPGSSWRQWVFLRPIRTRRVRNWPTACPEICAAVRITTRS